MPRVSIHRCDNSLCTSLFQPLGGGFQQGLCCIRFFQALEATYGSKGRISGLRLGAATGDRLVVLVDRETGGIRWNMRSSGNVERIVGVDRFFQGLERILVSNLFNGYFHRNTSIQVEGSKGWAKPMR